MVQRPCINCIPIVPWKVIAPEIMTEPHQLCCAGNLAGNVESHLDYPGYFIFLIREQNLSFTFLCPIFRSFKQSLIFPFCGLETGVNFKTLYIRNDILMLLRKSVSVWVLN